MTGEQMIPLRLCPPAQRRPGVISVTVPSRRRASRLAASVRSLRETAKCPDLLEILVAHDPDDPGTGHAAIGPESGCHLGGPVSVRVRGPVPVLRAAAEAGDGRVAAALLE